jgi:hypothetical protein
MFVSGVGAISYKAAPDLQQVQKKLTVIMITLSVWKQSSSCAMDSQF